MYTNGICVSQSREVKAFQHEGQEESSERERERDVCVRRQAWARAVGTDPPPCSMGYGAMVLGPSASQFWLLALKEGKSYEGAWDRGDGGFGMG